MFAAKKKQHKKLNERNGLATLFVSPFMVPFLLLGMLPLLVGVIISFLNYNPYDIGSTSFAGLNNYLYLFSDKIFAKTFWRSLLITIGFSAVIVPILIIWPLLLAYFINFEPPGYKLFRAIFYLPSVVSITVVGIIFTTIFSDSEVSLFNAFFNSDIKWLSNSTLRWVVILIASIWWQTGGNFIIMLASLKNVPKSLYEACEADGGNKWHTLLNVTIPNIKGSIGICLFQTLIGYLSFYGQPTVIHHSSNKMEILSPMMLLERYMNNLNMARNTGIFSAAAIVFGFVIIIFTGIQQYCLREKKGGTKNVERYKKYAIEKNWQ